MFMLAGNTDTREHTLCALCSMYSTYDIAPVHMAFIQLGRRLRGLSESNLHHLDSLLCPWDLPKVSGRDTNTRFVIHTACTAEQHFMVAVAVF